MLSGTANHKSKGRLPSDVRKAILPIYIDLCKPEKLMKCLYGKTQNANETFNGMVWNRVPKATHVGIQKLTLAVYDAIAHFNVGEQSSLDILQELNIEPGEHIAKTCQGTNEKRKRRSAYRMSDKRKKGGRSSDTNGNVNKTKTKMLRVCRTKPEAFSDKYYHS